ncbi:MAG: hypothetical protein Q9167_006645 [Letrouitia subvulpina]
MSYSTGLCAGFSVDGYFIPAVGLGTFQGDDGNGLVKETVVTAIQRGYRHIDTATAYGNEREVGEGIKESGIPRDEIFIITKLAQTWHNPADVEEALNRSLRDLGSDYVDLYLMHFPHAYLPQHELLSFCSKENIHLMAHQPLGGRPVAVVNLNAHRSGPLTDPSSDAQVLLSWAVQRGSSVVPKTVRETRMDENRQLFRLDETDMKHIDHLAEEQGHIRFLDPRDHIGFDIFDESCDQPAGDE